MAPGRAARAPGARRLLAAGVGFAALAASLYVAYDTAIPAFRIYDGLWMILGAAVAVLLLAWLVRRRPRRPSVGIVAAAAFVGSWLPILVSALRHQMPLRYRIGGAWVLGGGDVLCFTLPLAAVFLWLAVRGETPRTGPE